MKVELKHIIFYLASVLLVACATESSSKSTSTDAIFKMEAPEKPENSEGFLDIESSFNQEMINNKLQDFYDLITLQQLHPEFTDELTRQFKSYTSDPISNFNTKETLSIENIELLGPVVTTKQGVQKLKLSFDKVLENTKVLDTIYAYIHTKTVTVDGKPMVSKKIRFSKN